MTDRTVGASPHHHAQKAPDAMGKIELLGALLFSTLLIFGGAGKDYPLIAALEQSIAVCLIGLCLFRRTDSPGPLPRSCLILICAVALLCLVQFLPLPIDIWSSLSGRGLARDVMNAAQAVPVWHLISLDPALTAQTLLELLPGVAVLLLGVRSRPDQRTRLIGVFLAAAVVSALLGAFQRVAGGDMLSIYPEYKDNSPGLFLHRNHQATFLLIAIPMAAYYAATISRMKRIDGHVLTLLLCGVIALFALATIATASRAGLLLLPLSLALAWMLHARKTNGRAVLATIVLLGLATGVAAQSSTVSKAIDRLLTQSDTRPQFWGNTARAAREYGPIGSGIGTFVRVYPTVEPREEVTHEYVNNAHNDYVELWLEGGVAGLVVLALAAGAIGLAAARRLGRQADTASHSEALAALSGLAILALHSVVEYPLRMMTIMALAGLLIAMLLGPVGTPAGERSSQTAKRASSNSAGISIASIAFGIAALCLLLLPVWAIGLSEASLARKEKSPDRALDYNPWSSRAMVMAGYRALDVKDVDRALTLGRRALSVSPLDSAAVGLLLQIYSQKQDSRARGELLRVAARLGWRDPDLQYALLYDASDRDDLKGVVARGDALMRINYYTRTTKAFLRLVAADPSTHAVLAPALARAPWRDSFLKELVDLSAEDVPAHVSLMEAIRAEGSPPTDEEINALLGHLVREKAFGEALAAGKRLSPATVSGNLLAPDSTAALFTAASRTQNPFSWRFNTSSGAEITAEAQHKLQIESSRPAQTLILQRLIIVPSQQIRLSGTVRETNLGSWAFFNWAVQCDGSGAMIVPSSTQATPSADGIISFDVRFDLPANCPAQTLKLNLDSSDTNQSIGIRLDSLSLN